MVTEFADVLLELHWNDTLRRRLAGTAEKIRTPRDDNLAAAGLAEFLAGSDHRARQLEELFALFEIFLGQRGNGFSNPFVASFPRAGLDILVDAGLQQT